MFSEITGQIVLKSFFGLDIKNVKLNGKSLEEEIIYLIGLKLNGYRSLKY